MNAGRLASSVLGAAFVLVVGLAAVDAVRNREAAPAATTSSATPERERLVGRLRSEQVHGELALTAPGGCDEDRVSLPELEPAGTDRGRACRRPDGVTAWRPDGALTELDERGVVLVLPNCLAGIECRRPLIPRGRLEEAGRRHPNAPLLAARVRVLVDAIAWLTDSRAAALLSLRVAGRPDLRGSQAVAFFENGRFDHLTPFFRGDLVGLRAHPRGRYVALAPGFVLRADGSEVSLPRNLVTARGVAWSPDGRWLALALRGAVTLVSAASLERYDRNGSGLRTIDVPLEAHELEWR
jgi:hypothetical protein